MYKPITLLTEQTERVIPAWIETHVPNVIQFVPLHLIEPSDNNIRLYIEYESLDSLVATYTAYYHDPENVVLPDPPVVRFRGMDQTLELLAGHRRVAAANAAGLEHLAVRVVTMDDMEAYKFIVQANRYETISTAETAVKVAEMNRLGFTHEEIREVVGQVAVGRYIRVGNLLTAVTFTDTQKKCDPTITVWHEAANIGADHLLRCFQHWDAGLWDEADCNTKFRRRHARALPQESYQKGLRLTVDGNIVRVRGTLDLSIHTTEELDTITRGFVADLMGVVGLGRTFGNFGTRRVTLYSPSETEDDE